MQCGKGQNEIHLVKIKNYNLNTGHATFESDSGEIAITEPAMRPALGGLTMSEEFVIRVAATPHQDGQKHYELLQVFQLDNKWNKPDVPPYSPSG